MDLPKLASPATLTTARLELRQWQPGDTAAFARLCADPDVMRFFPATLTSAQAEQMANKIHGLIAQRGWGFWAVEVIGLQKFISFVGLHTPQPELLCAPCVEIGWRLDKSHWGKGYATEAARAALQFGFDELGLKAIVAFTPAPNKPSQAVIRKIGMHNTGNNFNHPSLPKGHWLSEHVLYASRVTFKC